MPEAPPDRDSDRIELGETGNGAEVRPWPADDPHLAIQSLGTPGSAPPYCFIMADALEEMLVHGREEADHEVGGFLLGEFVASTTAKGALVREIAPALQTDASLVHVTFTHDTWADINARLDDHPDHPRIVGWYHTHPGFGPFYSAYDRFLHENFFNNPLHVGVVMDPRQGALSLYGWQDGSLVRANGLYVCVSLEPNGQLPSSVTGLAYIQDEVHTARGWISRLLGGRE